MKFSVHKGVAEEAPGAYKDVSAVVMAAEEAGLARRVAHLQPLVCIKGEGCACQKLERSHGGR